MIRKRSGMGKVAGTSYGLTMNGKLIDDVDGVSSVIVFLTSCP